MKNINISSGHGEYIRGASGIIDEVDEARKVTEDLAVALRKRGVEVKTFHDNTSHDQSTNLSTITNWHNDDDQQPCDLAISVHFNAFEQRAEPVGTECWYVTQDELAERLATAMASVGFINRHGKYSGDLWFLNQTINKSVLLECCFVDSQGDCDVYHSEYPNLIDALAKELTGTEIEREKEFHFEAEGTVSWFGGPDDLTGVAPDEGLAFIYSVSDKPSVFLSYQPEGSTGLARRLNCDNVPYVACRWPYDETNKSEWREQLLKEMALVYAPKTKKFIRCFPTDWGPHEEKTGRAADVSQFTLKYLGIETDDIVKVIFPSKKDGILKKLRELRGRK